MNAEIDELRKSVAEHEKLRREIEPQLETARREIELNKSMLDMLNNEIEHLNSDKIQLEKKLVNARRNTTPSVIVEEEEEDLIEEERASAAEHHGPIDVASDTHHDDGSSATHGSLLFLNKVNKSKSKIYRTCQVNKFGYKKDIEDMTFYVDELKSELEAERERNNEYATEVRTLRAQIDELKTGVSENTSTEESSINATPTSTLEVTMTKKLREMFENGRWEKEDNGEFENGLSESMREVAGVIKQRFMSYEKSIGELRTKEAYLEAQMEKIIADFKREIAEFESKLTERDNDKSQVR